MLWPKLQYSLQYDMADAVNARDDTVRCHLFDGYNDILLISYCNISQLIIRIHRHRGPRKVVDTVPHDVGDPSEDPYLKINSYLMHG